MALILSKKIVYVQTASVAEDASKHYVSVPAAYLSEPYELIDGDEIRAQILEVKKDKTEFPELKGEWVSFILKKAAVLDELYLSKNAWTALFRERGLVVGGYSLNVRLTTAIHRATKRSVELYSKVDFLW